MDRTNDSPIDRRTALSRLGGDERIYLDFVGSVIEDSPQMLASIRAALAGGRIDDAHCTAHGLKGMLATLEARPSMAAAQDVELLTKAGKRDEASAALERLAIELDRLALAVSEPA
jgi:HPt (histidine-containing phosphotransfer) domain-containing protein